MKKKRKQKKAIEYSIVECASTASVYICVATEMN